jgi:SPP1 family predicted phage head-tail adaptor
MPRNNVYAGQLDRKITVQRKTVTLTASGQQNETWEDVLHRCWATRRPMRGDERNTAAQLVAKEQVEFEIRYNSSVADLTPLDRVICPTPSAENEQTPVASHVYDVLAVNEIGRRRGLRIVTARWVDVIA